MAVIKNFEELEIWKLSRILFQETFRLIQKNEQFSRDFSLRDQIKRSSGSVMDNIAEGFGRGGNSEFVYFLSISNGSVSEYKSQLYRAFDSNYINDVEFMELYELSDKISKKTTAFIQYLRKSGIKGEKFRKHESQIVTEEPFVIYEINEQ